MPPTTLNSEEPVMAIPRLNPIAAIGRTELFRGSAWKIFVKMAEFFQNLCSPFMKAL